MAFPPFKKKPASGTKSGSAPSQEDGDALMGDSANLHSSPGNSVHDLAQTQDSKDIGGSLLLNEMSGALESENKTAETGDAFPMPLMGTRTAIQHQRILALVLAAALIVLAVAGWWVVSNAEQSARQASDVSAALLQSQRLAKSAAQAVMGDESAFRELRESSSGLAGNVRQLRSDMSNQYASDLTKVAPLAERTEKNANTILAQQKSLTAAGRALRTIANQSADLLAAAGQISVLEIRRSASAAEVSAAEQLVQLAQRIGNTANEMLIANGVNATAVSAASVSSFNKDIAIFQDVSQGLLDGSDVFHLPAMHDDEMRGKVQDLIKTFDQTRTAATSIFSKPQGLVDASAAQLAIVADGGNLAQALESLQTRQAAALGIGWRDVAAVLAPVLIILLSIAGMIAAQLRSSDRSQQITEQQRLAAEQQRQEAKRINDANQAAILRLMNELQTVAEGDLTQEATVTEDITGAIADSVNYTVEELRALVGNVQGAAKRVTQTTSQVETTSTELLATSTEQLREIRETGQSVVDMAGRINQVSAQAQESAQVARQSLKAATSGLTAVQDSIGGMNVIRDQIQETSKRIKRLGESSQEIGEITELIADITEQTNVLALNAAIQAASAGEAGRGFSVVAEEVQRLAERSADATRQIAALVKTIQTDTQDAIGAMERSTRGVVDGARLSDNAGAALSEIDRVSHRLAQLIEQISSATAQEAQKANVVSGNIRHIFAVTEQTGKSTRSAASQVRELARIADELRQSVARFKVA